VGFCRKPQGQGDAGRRHLKGDLDRPARRKNGPEKTCRQQGRVLQTNLRTQRVARPIVRQLGRGRRRRDVAKGGIRSRQSEPTRHWRYTDARIRWGTRCAGSPTCKGAKGQYGRRAVGPTRREPPPGGRHYYTFVSSSPVWRCARRSGRQRPRGLQREGRIGVLAIGINGSDPRVISTTRADVFPAGRAKGRCGGVQDCSRLKDEDVGW